MEFEWLLTSQMIYLESLSKISVRNSELEQFSHRPHDAVGDFYLFVQIIEKSQPYYTAKDFRLRTVTK